MRYVSPDLHRLPQVLLDMRGDIVARLTDKKEGMHIDWLTQGTTRLVVSSWPWGSAVMYRTLARRGSLYLLSFLRKQGIDSNARRSGQLLGYTLSCVYGSCLLLSGTFSGETHGFQTSGEGSTMLSFSGRTVVREQTRYRSRNR